MNWPKQYKENYLEINYSYKEIPIQGKLLAAKYTQSALTTISHVNQTEEIKENLAKFIAKKLIDDNLIKFTKRIDDKTFETEYMAHIYIAPSDQVQILRLAIEK